jgi:cytochrome c biogenesis protein
VSDQRSDATARSHDIPDTATRVTVDETPDISPRMSTAPTDPDASGERTGIGVIGWGRWAWRTLTSMRTALVLLFLLALASVPGSILPQRGSNPIRVTEYLTNDPVKGKLFDRLGLFDVFASPWFAAIYLLLFISLAGCVLPRSLQHARTLRSRPPAAPRTLARLPEHRAFESQVDPQVVLDTAAGFLRRARWRLDSTRFDGTSGSVAAEQGYARETGNLIFHIALLGLVAAIGVGSFGGFRGYVIVREGTSFADTRSQFDSFAPGKGFNDSALPPFAFTLDKFSVDYQRGGQQNGAPRLFTADVSVITSPGSQARTQRIEVNEPLEVGGVKVFLVGYGYAPNLTVRDATGTVVFHDSVTFLPQDGNFTSTGVVKIPDTVPQLGLQGFILPSAAVDPTRGPFSTFPAPDNPAVFLSAWSGDLGLDSGRPQSVYKLDTTRMTRQGIKEMRPGDSWALPHSRGSVTFDGYSRWASFAVAHDPGKEFALIAAIAAIAGLSLSLLVRRRRLWVRVTRGGPGARLVEVAGLTRSEHATIGDELDALVAHLQSLPTPAQHAAQKE